jgi:hypothetical protein
VANFPAVHGSWSGSTEICSLQGDLAPLIASPPEKERGCLSPSSSSSREIGGAGGKGAEKSVSRSCGWRLAVEVDTGNLGGRGGQVDGGAKPPQKPQLPHVSVPSQAGAESGQNQGQNLQQQSGHGGQGEFSSFPQMWGNPSFQQFGWQPPFPMQFMPQMMQGNQMQFQHGFPAQ